MLMAAGLASGHFNLLLAGLAQTPSLEAGSADSAGAGQPVDDSREAAPGICVYFVIQYIFEYSILLHAIALRL